ncbi:MAG: tetratricopeptide repeat protein [Pedosphaera sp.]|nr:tetratricopeptide repeat protein [Pedosphaera sp.]
MIKLSTPNSHLANAAEGWLLLGAPGDAQTELNQLSPDGRRHPRYLDLQWQVFAAGRQWDAAFSVAQQSIDLWGQFPGGWIQRAYAARRRTAGGLALAFECLIPADALFPKEPIIPYNLACYSAQLGKLDEAWLWFETAVKRGRPEDLRTMALRDEDLRPLWPRLAVSVGKPK